MRRRIAFRLVALLRAAAVVGAIFALVVVSTLVARRLVEDDERRRYPPPGVMVDLGAGQMLHLRIWGADNPGPTIILEASANYFSSKWAWIARALGEDYRVVAVDRPGMGWSVGGTLPRDARTSVDALTTALDIAGIGPPYVAVGHSLGGWPARLFAHDQGGDVLGLALLDTTHPTALAGLTGPATFYGYRALFGHFGLADVFVPQPDILATLPADEAERGRVVSMWSSHLQASADELAAWSQSAQQVREAGDLGDLPLLVIGAYASPESRALQADFANLSTRSTFLPMDNVGHTSMLTYEDEAALVTAELRTFIASLTAAQRTE